jgi:hypothetical protein
MLQHSLVFLYVLIGVFVAFFMGIEYEARYGRTFKEKEHAKTLFFKSVQLLRRHYTRTYLQEKLLSEAKNDEF